MTGITQHRTWSWWRLQQTMNKFKSSEGLGIYLIFHVAYSIWNVMDDYLVGGLRELNLITTAQDRFSLKAV
jgi:hypothetical protein